MEQNKLFSKYTIVGDYMRQYLESFKGILGQDATVLVTGETGTGKELVARWIHFQDPARRDKPFVKITIPNIGENIFESEVFGYEKGAFTGAISAKKGIIEVAEDGTVFMDEIENASPATQSKLLQLLEDRVYRKVGGTEYRTTEARFVIATNIDLQEMVKKGEFRNDLYYRLAVLEFHLPRLIERNNDILQIANYYIELLNPKLKKTILPLDQNKAARLLAHTWPGNVRELRNYIEKSMIFCQTNHLELDNIVNQPHEEQTDISITNYKEYMLEKESIFFQQLYQKNNGDVERIAERIDMSVPFVYKRIKELGIRKK